MAEAVKKTLETLKSRDPNQPEFYQAVEEVLDSLAPVLEKHPEYVDLLDRFVEPERVIHFRVPWLDDAGKIQTNRGFRVQFNQAIGPYKGGLRFHPSVNLSIIKFLGFEQVLKNSLTTLPLGGGKGGSDFDPKGKSDNEVMKFCQSFMTELYRHVGPNTDVPAGDIGVGGREIGFLFGQYKRITKDFVGILTGKGFDYGGSRIRPEATGYGLVYLAQEILAGQAKKDLKGLKVAISGSGNVAQFCAEKLLDLGAIPISFSDSGGYVYEEGGFNREHLQHVMKLKNEDRARISEYTKFSKSAKYVAGKNPWELKCDVAMPCATQNEIDASDAQKLVDNKCIGVFEGANMPSTKDAVSVYVKNKLFFGPAKAANAGGVAVSGLEMSQNSVRMQWTREEVDEKLKKIMKDIYTAMDKFSTEYGQPGNMIAGANIAGFVKVADAMLAQGCV